MAYSECEHDPVLLSIQDTVAWVTLNRPETGNRLDASMVSALKNVFEELEASESVRVVMMQAQGKHFCLGADIAQMKENGMLPEEINYQDALLLARCFESIAHVNKPLVAVVHGNVYGGGVGLVACADLVLCDDAAEFCLSELKLGMMPVVVSPYIVNAVGVRLAKYWIMTSMVISAAQAEKAGLVHRQFNVKTHQAILDETIQSLLHVGPNALSSFKSLMIRYELTVSVEDRAYLLATMRAQSEGQEGLLAFFGKAFAFMGKGVIMKIMEVGPRDGLQNELNIVDTEIKKLLIMRLIGAGLKWIEATSFVSPTAIPQLQDADQLFPALPKSSNVMFPVLVPNEKGLERAIAAGATHIAIFLSASDTFSQNNIHMSMPESVRLYEGLTKQAKAKGLWVRGYISCVMGCPYEGEIDPRSVAMLTERMRKWGVDEISLGDTIGVGTPLRFQRLIERVKDAAPIDQIAVHCHDTYGQGLANILTAINLGVTIIDSSVGGLGGCPYARGATGNVATEDVIYMLDGMGIETGVDLTLLAETGAWICKTIGREYAAKAGKAWLQRRAG